MLRIAGLFAFSMFLTVGAAKAALPDDLLGLTGVQGGVVVHVGCGTGEETLALAVGSAYVVQGLDSDASKVAAARAMLHEKKAYGPVSVRHWPHAHLPYADNMVNLLVSEDLGSIPMDEVVRILCPYGVAYVRRDGKWTEYRKPYPATMDEWTHYLHGPDGNAVAEDTEVAQPSYIQWMGGPKSARAHENLASVSAVVSARGRVFYIADDAPIASVALPSRWSLTARDAFNGVLLWKRDIGPWEGELRGFRSGPSEIARRLVAIGDEVYVTLGYGKPVTALDAATGRTLRTYEATQDALELIYSDGVLYVLTGKMDAAKSADAMRLRGAMPPAEQRAIVAVRAATGEVLWRRDDGEASTALPSTITVGEGRFVFQNPRYLFCMEQATGQELWRVERPVVLHRLEWGAPTIVIADGLVLAADRTAEEEADLSMSVTWEVNSLGTSAHEGELYAYSLATGEQRWMRSCKESYHTQIDVIVVDGEIWTGSLTKRTEEGITEILNLKTGEVARTRASDQDTFDPGMGHHRCYRNKATSNYLILGRSGAEFLDAKTGAIQENQWIRGTCAYGIMPANGLLYVPPHSCACFSQAKLNGFNAFAPKRLNPSGKTPQLEKGPAYGTIGKAPAETKPGDWPTYRYNSSRSGVSPVPLTENMTHAWKTPLQPPLSGITAADGRAYVASIDAHTVYALDMKTGKVVWRYTADGRVDSPPTVWSDAVIFGSVDGYVYCLRAEDGALAWRFRAARENRVIGAFDQLESAWPVHGSILVENGVANFAAGRSSFIDDGIWLYRVDMATGKELKATRVWSYDEATGETPSYDGTRWIDGALPDILASDGERLYMRHLVFKYDGTETDEKRDHLYSITGFLDNTWWHRTYWLYGAEQYGGWGGWWQMGNMVPAGRLLSRDGDTLYGFGRDFRPSGNAGQWITGEKYVLFSTSIKPEPIPAAPAAAGQDRRRNAAPTKRMYEYEWSKEPGLEVRALVKTEDNLFTAGPLGNTTHSIVAYQGGEGSVVRVFSPEDGSVKADLKLEAPPVFDGMAAADGKLLVVLEDGSVKCLAP